MRQKRLRAPEHWSSAYYHCISRVVGREFLLGDAEKEHFVRLMRRQERFCLVRVVSYCVLHNHFHLLVEESSQSFETMNDRDFLGHLKATRPKEEYAQVAQDFKRWAEQGSRVPIDELKASYFRRKGNVSFFMKGLKQEFTQWYNRKHQRHGTLWESRFKSVLINGMDAEALMMMSAYIDLNPVRAGIVEDPKDYRWSSYGEASTGRSVARQGIKQVIDTLNGYRNAQPVYPARALEQYRSEMFVRGEETGSDESGEPLRQGISREALQQTLEAGGKLLPGEALMTRIRYFTDGAVIGSKESVEDVFQSDQWRFGPKRSSGARPIRQIDAPDLCSLRDLRLEPIETLKNK